MRFLPIAISVLGVAWMGLTTPVTDAAVQAGPQWAVTDSAFETRLGSLVQVDEQGVRLSAQGGEEIRVPMERLVRLEQRSTTADSAGSTRASEGFVLHLRGGDRLQGRVMTLDEQGLTIELATFGTVHVPLESLLALVRPDDPAADRPWGPPPPAADEIILANADRLVGFLSSIEDDRWVLSLDDGTEIPVDPATIRQVRFADTGVAVPERDTQFRAKMAGGSLLSVDALAFAEGKFLLMYRGQEATSDPAGVVWLEPTDGPVLWLSDLPPSEQEHVPYLGQPRSVQVDGLSEGSGRGFAVRSLSRLNFEIPEGCDRLRVRYLMPAANTLGNVDLRILLDGRAAHEHTALRASDAPPPVSLELGEAKTLTLEVDYGEGLDVQDEVFWIEPALIRE